ncbi:MAG TPA: SigE family RNA polymerase sigma factor [Nocardioidaceae bacterium]|nr:SigE family RNA polymerase sigma factor [Nocardioidaceae bacterium]
MRLGHERPDDDHYVAFASSALVDLRRTAYLICGDWHRADDVAQEALIRIYSAWSRIERTTGLMPYARRTVVRLLVDHSRRPWRRETTGVAVDPAPVRDQTDVVDNRILLLEALAQLPPRRRACVVLRYFDDLSVAETAAALGCSEGTVKSQTSRGIDELRSVLEQRGFTDLGLLKGVTT